LLPRNPAATTARAPQSKRSKATTEAAVGATWRLKKTIVVATAQETVMAASTQSKRSTVPES
jgi:hypothetical protein